MVSYNSIKRGEKSSYKSWLSIPIIFVKDYFEAIIKRLRSEDVILDIGSGIKGKSLIQDIKKYYCLDIDKDINPDFVSIDNVPSDLLFDKIIIAEIIEHVSNETFFDWLSFCKKHLRAGGEVIITTPNTNYLKVFEFTHTHFFKPVDVELILKAFGFVDVKVFRLWQVPRSIIKRLVKLVRHPFTYFFEIDFNCNKIMVRGKNGV